MVLITTIAILQAKVESPETLVPTDSLVILDPMETKEKEETVESLESLEYPAPMECLACLVCPDFLEPLETRYCNFIIQNSFNSNIYNFNDYGHRSIYEKIVKVSLNSFLAGRTRRDHWSDGIS